MNAIILSLISWFIFLINPPIGLGSLVVLIETGLYCLMEYRIKKADDSEKDTLYNAYFILSVMLVIVTSVIMLFLYQLDGDSTVTLINKRGELLNTVLYMIGLMVNVLSIKTVYDERNKWLHRYGGRELYDYFDPEGLTFTMPRSFYICMGASIVSGLLCPYLGTIGFWTLLYIPIIMFSRMNLKIYKNMYIKLSHNRGTEKEYERLKHVVPGGIYTHYCLWFAYMIAFMVIGIKFLCYSQNIFVLSFLPTLKDLYAFYPFIVSIIGDFICAFILIYNLKQRN